MFGSSIPRDGTDSFIRSFLSPLSRPDVSPILIQWTLFVFFLLTDKEIENEIQTHVTRQK